MAKNNPKMVQFDKSKWTPSELTAPDGRKWTPSSVAEEKNLLAAHGYTRADKGKAKATRPTGGATPPDAK